MIAIWIVLAALTLLEGLRLRSRLAALPMLEPADGPVDPMHRFVVAPGVELDEATRRAASAYAREHGLEVLDLIPRDWHTGSILGFTKIVDFGRFRRDRFARGRTAGHAVLISGEVFGRAEVELSEAEDPIRFARLAIRLKRYASATTGFAMAPDLRALPLDLGRRWALLRELFGAGAWVALVWPPVIIGAVAAGLVVSLWGGLAALLALHLQPLVALGGRGPRPRDLWWQIPVRSLADLGGVVATACGRWRPPTRPDPVEARRSEYADLLAPGLDRFFEPRRETCPLCDGERLSIQGRFRDYLQHKPGRFVLERCADCGHIFQNPRLSLTGLDFYYRDFYEGLGEEKLDAVFGYSPDSYLQRARSLEDLPTPTAWLDVGGGHGHFCCAARDVWPQTRFDALDLSEAVEEAERRRWVDRGHRGLFPELAPGLAGEYDVVSMSHYLEHTRDQRAELAAAHIALKPGGALLVEVPNPESPLGRILGRWWVPWFQPQHQHLTSSGNLEKLLAQHGFRPVRWFRGEAHIGVDFLFAAVMWLERLAPAPGPWRPEPSVGARFWRGLVRIGGLPLLLGARLTDLALTPLLRRDRWSNAYRVLARRTEASPPRSSEQE